MSGTLHFYACNLTMAPARVGPLRESFSTENPGARYFTNAASMSQGELRLRLNFAVELACWKHATAACVGPSQIIANEASIKLMMFPDATRLMVESLRREPSFLVFLLQKQTGIRPYDGLEPGDLAGMSKRWVEWYDAGASR